MSMSLVKPLEASLSKQGSKRHPLREVREVILPEFRRQYYS